MKNVNEIAATINPAEMSKPYIKAIIPAATPAILVHFACQPLVILTKRLYNSDSTLLTVGMSGSRLFNLCKRLEAEGKLTADVSGITVTSKSKNMPVATATMDGETVAVNNVVVTPVNTASASVESEDGDTPPWDVEETAEPKGEAEPIIQQAAKQGPKPLSFFCKMAVDQASTSDFEWCLSKSQLTHVERVVQERFKMTKEQVSDLSKQFLERFTKSYGSTKLITPELLAWKYQEARFFITTSRGVFNYVVRKNGDGGDIFPADKNFEVNGSPRHYTANWEGEMDAVMKKFFSMNVLLKSVVN